MTICGIEIKAREAIFALVTQGAGGLEHVAISTQKNFALDDDENAASVKAFAALTDCVKANAITRIAIKKRSKRRVCRWPHHLQNRRHPAIAGGLRGAVTVAANP